jgi:hypothetical protein
LPTKKFFGCYKLLQTFFQIHRSIFFLELTHLPTKSHQKVLGTKRIAIVNVKQFLHVESFIVEKNKTMENCEEDSRVQSRRYNLFVRQLLQ